MDEPKTPPADGTPPTDQPVTPPVTPPVEPPATPPAPEVTQLTEERDTARAEVEQLRTQLSAQETRMSETDQTVTALTQERDAARAEAEQLRTQVALSGKVVDPVAATRLMGSDYRTADGAVDVDAFLTAYPYMRPQAAPTAPDGGGNVQAGNAKEAEIDTTRKQLEAAQKAGNRVLAVSLQSKLTELTRTQ